MYQLRPLNKNDLTQIAAIEQASRPTPWSEKLFADELTSSNSRPLVLATLDADGNSNTVVGYVMPWHIADEIQIQNIVVAPSHRKKGLGDLLLNVALKQGLDAGCMTAILEVRESNTAAVRLYEKYRFAVVGRRENYYRDGENALLMTLGPFETASELADYAMFIQKGAERLKKQIDFEIIA